MRWHIIHGAPVITETDDLFCHQVIPPPAQVALNDLSWADRAYQTWP
jgi:hypothetical protein